MKLKNVIGIAAATAAGAYLGSQFTKDHIERDRNELIESTSRYQYAPALVQGQTIQQWEDLKSRYMAKYGIRILQIAETRVVSLVKTLDIMQKQGGYSDLFPLAIPFDKAAMEKSLLRSGLRIHETGTTLILFAFVERARFDADRGLGSNYGLKKAMRDSMFLEPSMVVKFDPERKARTMEYIERGDVLIRNATADILSDIQALGLRCAFTTKAMDSEKFYSMATIDFMDDIRTLV